MAKNKSSSDKINNTMFYGANTCMIIGFLSIIIGVFVLAWEWGLIQSIFSGIVAIILAILGLIAIAPIGAKIGIGGIIFLFAGIFVGVIYSKEISL